MKAYGEVWENWWRSEHGSAPWEAKLDLSDWKSVPEPLDAWTNYGDAEIANHLGRLWFARQFDLTEAQANGPATISLGLFDDSDAVWINGEFIGSTSSWSEQRVYAVDEGVLKPGENTILINVLNTYGPGGMMGPSDAMRLEPVTGDVVPLGSDWFYRAVIQSDGGGPRPPWEAVTGYTTIDNAMMAPLHGMPLSAAIWYQGESNAGRADAYEGLLTELIGSWRDSFGEELPVIVVQLPGYGSLPTEPTVSGWAALQDAQRRVAIEDPLTGLVTTMDIGHRTDIHPPDKLTVAMRAVDVLDGLLGVTGNETDGYTPRSAVLTDAEIIVQLLPGAYKVVSSDRVISMEVCDDQGICEWADAAIEGDRLIVSLPERHTPDRVRFCWADAPICNLYSNDDVPVTPFELPVTSSN